MVQLCATTCSCIAILWVSIVSFAPITLCVASQRVFIVVIVVFISLSTQSGNFWIHHTLVLYSPIRSGPVSGSWPQFTGTGMVVFQWRIVQRLVVFLLQWFGGDRPQLPLSCGGDKATTGPSSPHRLSPEVRVGDVAAVTHIACYIISYSSYSWQNCPTAFPRT